MLAVPSGGEFMKIDFYTKAVLTVIAVSLAIIAIRAVPLIGPAVAQFDEPLSVRICDDFFDTRCANVDNQGRLSVVAVP
jgi:hypothetical protein